MASNDDRIVSTVRRVVGWLVAGDYSALEKYTSATRLSAQDIHNAVELYGRKLVMPADDGFEELDVVEVTGALPRTWSVRYDLWTEEGRSDLSLELSLVEMDDKKLATEIDDIHVL